MISGGLGFCDSIYLYIWTLIAQNPRPPTEVAYNARWRHDIFQSGKSDTLPVVLDKGFNITSGRMSRLACLVPVAEWVSGSGFGFRLAPN